MYKSFSVTNFRCFRDLTIKSLAQVNLISGKNNVGKTALLEALWLRQGYENPALGVRVDAFRGIDRVKLDELMWPLFSELKPDKIIDLSTQDSDGRSESLRIKVRELRSTRISANERADLSGVTPTTAAPQDTDVAAGKEVLFEYSDSLGQSMLSRAFPVGDQIEFEPAIHIEKAKGIFLPARFVTAMGLLAERLSTLAVSKREDKILRIMKIVEPRLQKLTVQQRAGAPMIYGDIGKDRLFPLPLMGEGMGRLLSISVAIPDIEKGILLIDEIENGFHHTIMQEVWRAIASLSRDYDVQIFATTHSLECIRAAHKVFASSDNYNFALHRLEQVKGKICAVTDDQELLDAAIEIDAEIR